MSKFNDIFFSERAKAIESKVISVLLMLAVYFLGMNSAKWTQDQLKEYAYNFCGIYISGNIQCYEKNIPINLFNTSDIPTNFTGFDFK